MTEQRKPHSKHSSSKSEKLTKVLHERWKRPGYRNARVKPVSTPYGDFPSATYAARALAPVLNVSQLSVEGMFRSKADKWSDWYYIDDEKK